MLSKRRYLSLLSLLLLLLLLSVLWPIGTPVSLSASRGTGPGANGTDWWNVVPEPETPSPYYNSIPYSEIPRKLREIQLGSRRVRVEVMGRSAGGRNLFLATVTGPGTSGRFGRYKYLRKAMIQDPERALRNLDGYGDFKVPVFINGSIHGDEYCGTDACIRLIEKLAYDDSQEVRDILDNMIVFFNVVQNPDGRVLGQRENSAGFDANRDFISQTQPEIKAAAALIAEWNPMVFLDLHGFVSPMLIEPCTPPHNPNYEYDLYIKWALAQAEAMEASVFANTGYASQIPFRDWSFEEEGYYWDDWPPIYAPMYAMFHGAYGHTLETPAADETGVDAHYWAVWGALNFVVENKEEMLRDQIEIFRRGFLNLPQSPLPDYILERSAFPDLERLELFLQDFPEAYVIPPDGPMQYSPHQPFKLVDFLLRNGVRVEKATRDFTLNGAAYRNGTYVVWMNQAKRGLANTILEDGLDVSGLGIEDLVFYSPPTSWSHPLLRGVHRGVMREKMELETTPIDRADLPQGKAESGFASAYAYPPTSINAFKAANNLMDRGIEIRRASEAFADNGREFGPGTLIVPPDAALVDLLANWWKLDLFAIENVPENTVRMVRASIAVNGDEGVRYCLKTLGFEYTEVSPSEIDAGAVFDFDLFLNQGGTWEELGETGKDAVRAFFAADGDYVGLTAPGIEFAVAAGAIDADYSSDYNPDAIVRIEFDNTDGISAGFFEEVNAYVLGASWFNEIPGDARVAAYFSASDLVVAGFWPGWPTSGAAGMPVIVHRENGRNGRRDVVLIGIDATFRGHPENTFRLVGNAIFSCMD